MKNMNLFFKRFFYIAEGQPTNPFIPLFVILSFITGITIIMVHVIPGLPEIILFELVYKFLGVHLGAYVWGFGMILSSVLHSLEVYYRNGRFGSFAAWISLLLWSYVMGAYIAELFLFAGVIVTPFVFFWGYYLVKWRGYKRSLREGLLLQIER